VALYSPKQLRLAADTLFAGIPAPASTPKDKFDTSDDKEKPHLRVHVGIQPDHLQAEIIDGDYQRGVGCFGRQRGKTVAGLLRLLRIGLQKPGSVSWYVAPTYRAAKRIAWDKALALFPRGVIARVNETELTFTLINGSKICLMGAENPEDLRGQTITGGVVIDEWGTVNVKAWTVGIQPSLAPGVSVLFIGTPNAKFGPHFRDTWDTACTDRTGTWRHWHSPTADAPYDASAKIEEAKKTLQKWEYHQEYLAEFHTLSGAVWPEYNDKDVTGGGHTFVVKPGQTQAPLPRGWACVAGMDFGATHPTAVVWIGVGPSGQVKVLAEYQAQSRRASQHAGEIRRISELYGGVEAVRFIGDPSEPQMFLEYQAEGIIMEKANNNQFAGFERVGRLLTHGYLTVGECCTELREQLLKYHYDPRSIKPKVVKERDDLVDAFRYAVMSVRAPLGLSYDKDAEFGNTLGVWEEDPVFSNNWEYAEKQAETRKNGPERDEDGRDVGRSSSEDYGDQSDTRRDYGGLSNPDYNPGNDDYGA
jgi:hypothetical protein